GNIRDVQQAIDAAEIDERAVIGDVLDHPIEDLALGQIAHQAGAILGPGLLHDGAARHDDVAAAAVHLEDGELLGLAHQGADVAHRTDIDLAARQEGHGATEVDRETALHAAEDRAHDALAVGEGLLEQGPGFFSAGLVARQDGFAILVLHTVDEDVDHVAFLDLGCGAAIGELAQGNAALRLQPNIDHHEIIGNANDAALDDRAFEARGTAQRFLKKLSELRTRGVVRRFLQGAALWHSRPLLQRSPGETLPPVGQPVKSGGSTAAHATAGRHRPAAITAKSFGRPAATYGPAERKPLRAMNTKATAKAASASMSLVSRREASGAAFKGAAARSLSRRSRSAISARTRGFIVSTPRSRNSWYRRSARALVLAVTNNFTGASGQITVPMSRPSSTAPDPRCANFFWKFKRL